MASLNTEGDSSELQAVKSNDKIMEIYNPEERKTDSSKLSLFTPREAWKQSNRKMECISRLSGLPALRICVICCLLLTIIGLVVCGYVYSDTATLRNGLMGSYENALKIKQDIGIISELVGETKRVRSDLEALSSWANGSACIAGSGLLYKLVR